jgi:hypothetical protein
MGTFQVFENLEGLRKKHHPAGQHCDTNRSKRYNFDFTFSGSSGTSAIQSVKTSDGVVSIAESGTAKRQVQICVMQIPKVAEHWVLLDSA